LLQGLAVAGLLDTSVLITLYGKLTGNWLGLLENYKSWYNAISLSEPSLLPKKGHCAGVTYNAVDVIFYNSNGGLRAECSLFLCRISPGKGLHIVIEAAK